MSDDFSFTPRNEMSPLDCENATAELVDILQNALREGREAVVVMSDGEGGVTIQGMACSKTIRAFAYALIAQAQINKVAAAYGADAASALVDGINNLDPDAIDVAMHGGDHGAA